jgi:ubiquitin thioesterase protein OTUB1
VPRVGELERTDIAQMMTSAFMQLREDQYQPFLEMPLNEYRLSRIDPTNQEIDQIGLQALTDGVIAPACIAVEVSYLDRSQGDEVTPHQFVPDAAGWPTIRLLYRPYVIANPQVHIANKIQWTL